MDDQDRRSRLMIRVIRMIRMVDDDDGHGKEEKKSMKKTTYQNAVVTAKRTPSK